MCLHSREGVDAKINMIIALDIVKEITQKRDQ